LNVDDRPVWRTVRGGSQEYARKLVAPFRDRIALSTPIRRVRRDATGVTVTTAQGDQCAFRSRLLRLPFRTKRSRCSTMRARAEREVLGAFRYPNRRARPCPATMLGCCRDDHSRRAAWNYHLTDRPQERVPVTYLRHEYAAVDRCAGAIFC
jgi:predicted NAD/FAD-binding protein